MTRFVAVDLETTSVDPFRAFPLEIATVEIGPTLRDSRFVPYHDRNVLAEADFGALAVNRYFERQLFNFMCDPRETAEAAEALAELLEDATIVGANPHYDAQVLWNWLAARLPMRAEPPWHFRLFDVEAATMTAHALDSVPSLSQCCELWGVENHDPHSALGDALATARVFNEIRLWSGMMNEPAEPVSPGVIR